MGMVLKETDVGLVWIVAVVGVASADACELGERVSPLTLGLTESLSLWTDEVLGSSVDCG